MQESEYDTCECGNSKQKKSYTCLSCYQNRSTKKNTRKPCRRCGGEKQPGVARQICDACRATGKQRGHQASNEYHFAWKLKRKYGISVQDYERMYAEQDGRCAICTRPERIKRKLAVDHDHISGKVRSLLCLRCNLVLGKIKDDPTIASAIKSYLLHHEN